VPAEPKPRRTARVIAVDSPVAVSCGAGNDVRSCPDFYQASACRTGVVDLGLGCPEQAGDVADGAGL
jgi:hypothetical protein